MALCLDYDFTDVSGDVGIQLDLPIDYPENYAFAFQIRGDSPANDLEMKFVDESGDNVWWVKRTGYEFPTQWTPVRYKKRHIVKAWGPSPDRVLRNSAKLEFTRSEEHTSELQSLMRISYAVFCLKKKKKRISQNDNTRHTIHD